MPSGVFHPFFIASSVFKDPMRVKDLESLPTKIDRSVLDKMIQKTSETSCRH